MAREELRRDDALGGLLGDGLGPVLAELGQLAAAVLLRPRAAWAVESVPLVQPGQRRGGTHRPHLLEAALHRHQHRFDAGGLVLSAGRDYSMLVVRDVDVASGVTSAYPCASILGRS